MVSPLLSRSLLLTLQPLTDDDDRRGCSTVRSPTSAGLGGAVALTAEAARASGPDWPAVTPDGR